MNSNLQIQKLLACSNEFDEFQELDILIESPFVCETVDGEGVKQVFLGLSPIMLLMAEQRLLDYKFYPDVIYGNIEDPEMEGMELIKALPLSMIKLQCVEPHKLVVTAKHKPTLYLELCNSRLNEKALNRVWAEWVNLVKKIRHGIPLTAAAVPCEDLVKTPIYKLYAMADGMASYRGSSDYSTGGYRHLHDLVRSYNTMSKYRGRSYSDVISDDISRLEGELTDTEKHPSSYVADVSAKASCQGLDNKIKKEIHSTAVSAQSEPKQTVTVEDASESSTEEKSPSVIDSQLTDASSIITRDALLMSAPDTLNTNNAANDDQSKKSKPHPKKPVAHRSVKRIPFMYDNLPSNAELGQDVVEDLTVKRDYDPAYKGRQFIRSSSIMVKSGGREISALDVSNSKGRAIHKQEELKQASLDNNMNVYSDSIMPVQSKRNRKVTADAMDSQEKVVNTWAQGDPRNKEKKLPKKSKSRKSAHKPKTTHEIMKEKFGSLSVHVDTESAVKRANLKSVPISASENTDSSVHIDHISLQLTEHPSYTLDEDKLTKTYSDITVSNTVQSEFDTFGTISTKRPNEDKSVVSHGFTNNSEGATSINQMETGSSKALSQPHPHHHDRPPTPHAQVIHDNLTQSRNGPHKESDSLSNVINLTNGIQVPHSSVDQWSHYANEPYQPYEAYYHEEAIPMPYQYMMFNPQADIPVDHLFVGTYPTMGDNASFVIQEMSADHDSSLSGASQYQPGMTSQARTGKSSIEDDHHSEHQTVSPPGSSRRRQSVKSSVKNKHHSTVHSLSPPASSHGRQSIMKPKSSVVSPNSAVRHTLENERVAALKSVALSPISSRTEQSTAGSQLSGDTSKIESEMYKMPTEFSHPLNHSSIQSDHGAESQKSYSALLPVHEEEDEETVSDLAFPHLKHSSVIPQWITKRKPPSVKHKIGTSNSEILDDQGRPAWLNDKQKDFFVQLQILKSLNQDLDFDIYDCQMDRGAEKTTSLSLNLTTHQSLDDTDVDHIVREIQEQLKLQPQPKSAKLKKRRWDFFKAFQSSRPDTDGFEDSHIRVPMSTQLTLKAIDILENKYHQNFKEIVRWNVMARQIDMPDFTTIKMNLSLPVIEPSLENINQNQALLSKQPYQYGPSKCSIQDVYSGHDPNSESSGLMGVVNHSFMPEDATPVDSVCSIAAERYAGLNINNNANNKNPSNGSTDSRGSSSIGSTTYSSVSKHKKPLTSSAGASGKNVIVLKELGPDGLFRSMDKVEEETLTSETIDIQPHLATRSKPNSEAGTAIYMPAKPKTGSKVNAQIGSKTNSQGGSKANSQAESCTRQRLENNLTITSQERVPTADTVYDSILLHHTPEDIVKELTLIDRGLLIQVNFDELLLHLNNSSSQQILYGYQPVAAIVKLSERFNNYFVSEILRCQDQDIQIEVLHHVIQICELCTNYQNYNSTFSISESLTSHSLQRLTYLWAGLKKRYPQTTKTWAKLLKLCERKGDYKAYNTAIQRAMRAMENKPHMPYLGLYLQKVIDLTCRWNVVKSDAIEVSASNRQPKPTAKQPTASKEKNIEETLKSVDLNLRQEIARFNTKETYYNKLLNSLADDEETLNEESALLRRGCTTTHEEKQMRESMRRQLLLHQLASVQYDFESNPAIRNHLLRSPYNCEIKNYILSLKFQPLNLPA